MNQREALELFQKSGALLSGHFQLTSGLHSDTYFQCALVLQHPRYAEALCRAGQDKFQNAGIDTVVAPAVGGIVVGQELARLLGVRSIFAERQDGQMTLRRGFSLTPVEKVVVAEDVITTGGSVAAVIELAQNLGAEVVGVFAIVDRSGGKVDFGVPFSPVVRLEAQAFKPEACPLCAKGSAIIKPGSRGLR